MNLDQLRANIESAHSFLLVISKVAAYSPPGAAIHKRRKEALAHYKELQKRYDRLKEEK